MTPKQRLLTSILDTLLRARKWPERVLGVSEDGQTVLLAYKGKPVAVNVELLLNT